jgi:hypothetical protein
VCCTYSSHLSSYALSGAHRPAWQALHKGALAGQLQRGNAWWGVIVFGVGLCRRERMRHRARGR